MCYHTHAQQDILERPMVSRCILIWGVLHCEYKLKIYWGITIQEDVNYSYMPLSKYNTQPCFTTFMYSRVLKRPRVLHCIWVYGVLDCQYKLKIYWKKTVLEDVIKNYKPLSKHNTKRCLTTLMHSRLVPRDTGCCNTYKYQEYITENIYCKIIVPVKVCIITVNSWQTYNLVMLYHMHAQ